MANKDFKVSGKVESTSFLDSGVDVFDAVGDLAGKANAAFAQANAAYAQANTAGTPAFNQANTANVTAYYASVNATAAFGAANVFAATANAAFNKANNALANVNNTVLAGGLGLGNTVFTLGGSFTNLTIGDNSTLGRITIFDSSSGRTTFQGIPGGGYRFQGVNSSGNIKDEFQVYPGVGTYFRSYGTDFDLVSTTGDAYSGITGVNIDATGNLKLKVLDTDIIRLENTGNVAIGRTQAGYKLDVVGTINASAVLVNGSPITATGMSVNVGSTVPPSGNTVGQLWWNSDTGKFLIYYTDSNSSQWVEVSTTGEPGPQGPAGAGGTGSVEMSSFFLLMGA